jgi:hypothetical protein
MFRNVELKKLRLTKIRYAKLRRRKLGNLVKTRTVLDLSSIGTSKCSLSQSTARLTKLCGERRGD